jgi:ribosomal protein S18 acetylase RimI-like enzyme
MVGRPLTFRRMDATLDGPSAFDNYREACVASFGSAYGCASRDHYLNWLQKRIEGFPDGHVIASIGEHFVGQLELQIPYGLKTGYINLFYVAPEWRRLGLGRRLHGFAEQYFRSWEATEIELDVSPTNGAAVDFYRSLGYRNLNWTDASQRTRRMRFDLIEAII